MISYDVIIVGGGIMGCSCAFHLIQEDPALRIAVIEKDPSYDFSSTTLSLANIRIQFSLEENIQISRYSFTILENFSENMTVAGEKAEVFFREEGNLFLTNKGETKPVKEALERQQKLGGEVSWWSPARISKEFPSFNAYSYAGGTYGVRDGHLDAYAFLNGYRNKAQSLGVTFLTAEVSRIISSAAAVTGVQLSCGTKLIGKWILNCAGAWAAQIAGTAGIKIPVYPVKRQVFVAAVKHMQRFPLPLVNLPSGLYFRSEGAGQVVVGKSMADDAIGYNFSVDETRFYQHLWPELVQFIPPFDRLKLLRGWAGLYAENSFDGNPFLGEWPDLKGFYLVTGFSGHGLQQAPAVGRYLSELIMGGKPSLDLSIFNPLRLFENKPIQENLLV